MRRRTDFAVAGALALNEHGVLRATEDVEILITREGLRQFKDKFPADLGTELNEYVRAEYDRLWTIAQAPDDEY